MNRRTPVNGRSRPGWSQGRPSAFGARSSNNAAGFLDQDTWGKLQGAFQAFSMVNHWLQRWRANAQYARAMQALEDNQVSGRLRDTRLGLAEDFRESDFTTEPGGLYVGCMNGQPYFYHGDRHCGVMGGSGSGKSSCIAMPMTISTAIGKKPESVVVWDLKAELSWTTAHSRSALDGQPALHFAPWGLPWAKSVRFNFLEFLAVKAARGRPILDDVRSRVRMVHANADAGSETSANGWVNKAARRVSICLLAHRAECESECCTPGDMADAATWTQAEFAAEMQRLAISPAAGGYVADLALKLKDSYGRLGDEDSAKEYAWVMESYSDAWELYSRGSDLREAVSETTFDLEAFKRRPQALYVYFPDTKVDSHASFIALCMDAIVETLATASGDVRTTLICDEFVNFPRTSITLKALRLYRDRKTRLVTFTQDRGGFDKYRNEGGFKTFFENSFGLCWGQRDPATQRDIQERAGYRSVLVRSENASISANMDTGGFGVSEQITPVLPADEIARIDTGEAILDAPGHRLTLLERPLFKALPFCAPYVRDKFKEPMPEPSL